MLESAALSSIRPVMRFRGDSFHGNAGGPVRRYPRREGAGRGFSTCNNNNKNKKRRRKKNLSYNCPVIEGFWTEVSMEDTATPRSVSLFHSSSIQATHFSAREEIALLTQTRARARTQSKVLAGYCTAAVLYF